LRRRIGDGFVELAFRLGGRKRAVDENAAVPLCIHEEAAGGTPILVAIEGHCLHRNRDEIAPHAKVNETDNLGVLNGLSHLDIHLSVRSEAKHSTLARNPSTHAPRRACNLGAASLERPRKEKEL